MMESIRTGVQKPWIKILLGIVIFSFIFAGVFTAQSFRGSPDAVAEVNGEEVRQREWDNAINAEAARYGEQFNQLFSTDERKAQFRLDALDKLINSRAVAQQIEELGFRASASQITDQVKDIPAFQVDGKFSTEAMDQLLAARGMSRESLKQMMSENVTQTQFIQVFSDTQFALPSEVTQRIQLEQQQRTVKSLVVKAAPFEANVEMTDEEIQAHYDANINRYEVKETLTVEYIELKSEDLANTIEISDEEIQTYYTTNADLYRSEEERQVAHILIKTEERSEEEAKAQIDAIAARLAAGEDFAAVAKAESEDFSAEQGGDLGFSGRGVMVPEFETAMFDLQNVGDVSDVVKTEFGYHIIKLLAIQDGEVRPLEEVKDQIVSRMKQEKAEEKFYITKDSLERLAFDRYDSLSAAAAETQLEIKTSAPFSRVGGAGVFANPAVATAAFSESVLVDKRNSEVIEINENHVVVLRAKEHTPSRIKPLEEVKEQVIASLKKEKARQKATEKGEELVAKLKAGDAVDTIVRELGLEWKEAKDIRRNSTELGFELTRMAFKAPKPEDGSVSTVGNSMMNGDFAVIQITEVKTPQAEQLSDAEKKQAQARIQRAMGDSGYASYVESVKKDSKIVKFEDKIQ